MRLKLLKIGLVIVRFFYEIGRFLYDLLPPLSKMRGVGDLLNWFFHTGIIGRLVFVITGMSGACPSCKRRVEKLNKLIPFSKQKEQKKHAHQEKAFTKKGKTIRKTSVKGLRLLSEYNLPVGIEYTIKVQIFAKVFETISGKTDDKVGKELLEEFEEQKKPPQKINN